MCFCSRQTCLIVLNHYNSVFSGHSTFSVPICLCLRLLGKVGCVEPMATIFPLGRYYDAPGFLGLLLCHLGGSTSSVPGPPAEAPVRRKGIHSAPGLRMDGRFCHGVQLTLPQSRQLFLFGLQLQSFPLPWTCIPSFIFQCCKPCSSPRALKVKLLSQA